jgi:serine/threonine protein kinase
MHKVFGRSKTKDMSHKVLQKSLTHAEKLRSVRLTENPQMEDFEKVRTLGTGTFGRVYLVKHQETGKFYALKVLRKMDVVRLKQVDHIKNEKNILLELNHPFIVTLYATWQDETNLYMLMDYVIGGELFSYLRRAGRFANDTARMYAAMVVMALEHLHAKNILYRDLKPENLLIDKQGYLKICDFGFAKHVEDRTWTLCGTPEYLAPEIIQSKGHGKAVDWWALGVLLFEMLAGYPPFFDDNPFGVYEKILAGRIHFPSHFDPDAKDLVRKLLAADRTQRLGNLKGGAEDVKNHPYFQTIDWQQLLEAKMRAPIVVRSKGEGDASNFETYEEVEDQPVSVDPFKFIFKDF